LNTTNAQNVANAERCFKVSFLRFLPSVGMKRSEMRNPFMRQFELHPTVSKWKSPKW